MKLKRIFKITLLVMAIISAAYYCIIQPRGETAVVYDPADKTCFGEEVPILWHACIYSAKQGTTGSVAYYLHGRNHDEQSWNDEGYFTAQIQKIWQTQKIKPPKIVAVSFGPFWLLTPKNSAPKGGLLDFFTNHVILEVEKRTGVPKKRLLFGESMGGVNTLIVALRAGSLFSRALSLCPPIYKMSPFSDLGTIKEFLEQTGADPRTIFGVKAIAPQFAANENEWNEISPVKLLEKVDATKVPELYLSCGLYDKYGNYLTAENFVDSAKAKGINIQWHPLYGGHCAVDVTSVADFISKEN